MAVAVAKVGKEEDLIQRVKFLENEVTNLKKEFKVVGGQDGVEKLRRRLVLTSSDVEFRRLVHERAKNAPSLEEVRKILNKVDVSLTQMLLEERGNRREKW